MKQWRRWKEKGVEEEEKVKAADMEKEVKEKEEFCNGVTCRTGC